jgi:GPI-anchor transamidase subunit GAA1
VIESLCRSLNNLLEHLHQSFFFYFLLSASGKTLGEPGRFVSIGTYLPAAMIMAASFTITAIALWMKNSESSTHLPLEKDKSEPIKDISTSAVSIGFPLGVVAILHGLGFIVLTFFDWVNKAHTLSIPVGPLYIMLTLYEANLCVMQHYSSSRDRCSSHSSSDTNLTHLKAPIYV